MYVIWQSNANYVPITENNNSKIHSIRVRNIFPVFNAEVSLGLENFKRGRFEIEF